MCECCAHVNVCYIRTFSIQVCRLYTLCMLFLSLLHEQTRPGTENDDFDELMQTYVCSDIPPTSPQATTSPTAKKDTPPPEQDPETSLITDFQVVTDIRVCGLETSVYTWYVST